MFNPYPKPLPTDKKKRKPLKRTPIKRQYKATGEGQVFDNMIATLPHISFVSGLNIDKIDGKMDHNNCHHVLFPKDWYKKARLLERYIVFITKKEHGLIQHGTKKQRDDYAEEMKKQGVIVDWQKLYDYREQLFNEYKIL